MIDEILKLVKKANYTHQPLSMLQVLFAQLRSLNKQVFRSLKRLSGFEVPWVPEDIFFLSILMAGGEVALTRKKITSGHRSTQPHFHVRNQFRIWTGSPIGYSHVKLFDVANQGQYYIVNSLRTWEYPVGDPVQILNRQPSVSIRKKYPLEPRVVLKVL